jgi:HK97 family phage major capsid protein
MPKVRRGSKFKHFIRRFNMKRDELIAKKSALLAEMEGIVNAAADGVMTDEQQKSFDGKKAEVEQVTAQVARMDEIAKMQADLEKQKVAPSAGRTAPAAKPFDGAEQIVIPASAYRGSLKNFKGNDAELKAYKAGMWLLAANGNQRASKWCSEHGIGLQWLAGQTEGTNTAGGYLVYPEFDNAIIDLRLQYGTFRRNARITPMSSDILYRPRRTGGLTAYFVGESDAGTESSKSWDRIQLTAKKIMVLAKMSNELSEDAVISIADDLTGEIGYAFAYKEDVCGWNGDATSTYGGIVGVGPKLIQTACTGGVATGAVTAGSGLLRYGTGNAWSNVALSHFNTLISMLPSYARAGAKFYCSPVFHDAVMQKLAYAAGGNSGVEIVNGVPVYKFLGYPVELVEVMSGTEAVNTIYCYFGNIQLAAMFGDRRQTTLAFSTEASVGGVSVFERDEVAVRGTERFDINVHDVGSSSTRGPVVGLISHTA